MSDKEDRINSMLTFLNQLVKTDYKLTERKINGVKVQCVTQGEGKVMLGRGKTIDDCYTGFSVWFEKILISYGILDDPDEQT